MALWSRQRRRSCPELSSCEPGDEVIPFFVDHVGEDAMVFASDYLHFDALFVGELGYDGNPYPGTVATLLGRKDVSDSAKRKQSRPCGVSAKNDVFR